MNLFMILFWNAVQNLVIDKSKWRM